MKITDAFRLALFVDNIKNDDRLHAGLRLILITLAKSSCGMTSAELEFTTGYSQGAISVYIRDLLVAELLEQGPKRTGPQNPGLAHTYQMTDKAWMMYEEMLPVKTPTLGEQILQYVAPANHQQVRELLKRLANTPPNVEVRYELAG